MRKRVAAVVLALSLLRVNALRADVACARHEPAPVAESVQYAAAEHHHTSPDTEQPAPDEDCTTPVQAECCQALTSCSVFLELDADVLATGLRCASTVRVAVSDMPRSRIAPPDPPPPRA